jgi:hypothetical protein
MSNKVSSNPFSNIFKTVSETVKKSAETVAKKTTDTVNTLKKDTAKHTAAEEFHKWGSNFEAKDGTATLGYGRGYGSKLDEAPSQKTLQTKNYKEPEEVTGLKNKAKEGIKNGINNVGIKVFDPEKSKFEAEAAVISKKVDEAVVDKKGYDVGYRVLSAYAEGSGNIKIGKATNIEGKVEAGAVLGQVTVQGKKSLGAVDLTGSAQATVGALANAEGKIQVDLFSKKPTVKVKAGVDAFAGAKVSAEGRIGNDYAGVGVKGEAMAGIGVKAKVDAGLEGGRFKAKVELGACLGIGGSISFNVDVNYQKIGEKAVEVGKSAVKAVGNAASAVGNAVGGAVSSGWKTVSGWFS